MIARGTLIRHLTDGCVFVETGTREGNTLAWAVDSNLPSHSFSAEIDGDLAKRAYHRFAKDNRVTIYHGNSVFLFKDFEATAKKHIVFWLDAHTKTKSPLLDELEEIAKFPRKTHTILIDDVRLLTTRRWGISFSQVVDALFKINPNYKLLTADGYEPGDILIARIYP